MKNGRERRMKMGDKKVLVFLGSPRKKGNSALLAAQVMDGARAAGAKVESVGDGENGLKYIRYGSLLIPT